MNVADICPVGALTTRDFRFKIRVWFTDDVDSVCNQCARGCNISASRSNNKIYRYVPRRNDAVNDTWMCDHGRMSYKLNAQGRLIHARVDGKPGQRGRGGRARRRAGCAQRAHAGGKIVGVASPFASNEELEAFRDFLASLGAGAARFAVPRGESDEILIEAEKAPNASGLPRARHGRVEPTRWAARSSRSCSATRCTPPAFADVQPRRADRLARVGALRARRRGAARAHLPREAAARSPTPTGCVQRFDPVVEPAFEALSEREALAEIAKTALAAARSAR